MEKLSIDFYEHDDVVQIAKNLVGKVLHTNINGQHTSGTIVETEAYNGRRDKACHAFLKRTKRTEIMYGRAGMVYVYLCYGIHRMFNIVTNKIGMADAILVRAIEPIEGVDIMHSRRQIKRPGPNISSGPGNVAKAMGIELNHYGVDLSGDEIWITEGIIQEFEIEERRRVGVDYAEEDAQLLWRFTLKGSKYISKPDYR